MNKDYWLFCFVNTHGYYKIGKTTNVSRRVNQLKKEGPDVICFAKQTENANNKVKIIHSLLIKYRNIKGLFEIKNIILIITSLASCLIGNKINQYINKNKFLIFLNIIIFVSASIAIISNFN